jgi:hypothetical protein
LPVLGEAAFIDIYDDHVFGGAGAGAYLLIRIKCLEAESFERRWIPHPEGDKTGKHGQGENTPPIELLNDLSKPSLATHKICTLMTLTALQANQCPRALQIGLEP